MVGIVVVGDFLSTDRVLAGLTVALVGTTVYYAAQTQRLAEETRQIVQEMRLTRELQVMPRLIPAVEILGPNELLPRVANIGPGSALDIRVKFTLEPAGPSTDYVAALMTSGRGKSVFLSGRSSYITRFDEFEEFDSFRIAGNYSDALGNRFLVNEAFDLRGHIRDFKAGMWARTSQTKKEGEPLELIADALVNIEAIMRRAEEAD